MHSEQIKKIITRGLVCEHLDIEGDGDHFDAILVSAAFDGKSRVERQQCVYALLKSYLDSGELHAISMKTHTPAEWSALNG